MDQNFTGTMREPPEGALTGEDVPRENDHDEQTEATIKEVMNALKLRGEPYTDMDESTLRERAERFLGVDN